MRLDSDPRQLDLFTPELAVRKVGANYHVPFQGAYYSVPFSYFGEMVIIRASRCSIDILASSGFCVATHNRSFARREYVTNPSHLPGVYYSIFYDNRYDAAKLRSWAKYFGSSTHQIIDILLASTVYEEQAYKKCIAVLQLSKKYGSSILERACRAALSTQSYSFSAIQKIAKIEHDRHKVILGAE